MGREERAPFKLGMRPPKGLIRPCLRVTPGTMAFMEQADDSLSRSIQQNRAHVLCHILLQTGHHRYGPPLITRVCFIGRDLVLGLGGQQILNLGDWSKKTCA